MPPDSARCKGVAFPETIGMKRKKLSGLSIAQIINNAIHGKHYRVKARVYVKPLYCRDAKGRFKGGFLRRGYWRTIYDRKSPMVSNHELLIENIKATNALIKRFNQG